MKKFEYTVPDKKIICPVCGETSYVTTGKDDDHCPVCFASLRAPDPRPKFADRGINKPGRRFTPPPHTASSKSSAAKSPEQLTVPPMPDAAPPVSAEMDSRQRYSLNSALFAYLRSGQPIKLITGNGFCLDGKIIGWDKDSVCLDSSKGRAVVMRSAISTILPF